MQVADRGCSPPSGQCRGEAEPNQENHERLVSMIVGGADEPADDEDPKDEDGERTDE